MRENIKISVKGKAEAVKAKVRQIKKRVKGRLKK